MKANDLIQDVESKLHQLAKQTEKAKSSKVILDYLQFISQFHSYSFHNVLSIYTHCPKASHVAGFSTWKKLGRFVRKGEKGIPILAPCTQKVTQEDKNGNEEQIKRIMFFKIVYVFDISQTEGKAIPEAPITATGSDAGLLSILEQITANHNIKLEYKSLLGSHHGTSYGGRIEVNSSLDPAGKSSVVIHELAHELLHRGDDRHSLSRQQKELEAEATAHVVCSHFKLTTASANYLALWEIPSEEITGAFQRIHKVAVQLINEADVLVNQSDDVVC